MPRLAVPLLLYLAVTLAAPAVNGATRRDGFWEHAAITAIVSGGLTGMGWLGCRVLRRMRALIRCRRPRSSDHR